MAEIKIHPASYKDPAGFIFLHEGKIFRQVNQCYAQEYTQLMESGLYRELTTRMWLIPHTETDFPSADSAGRFKTLLPACSSCQRFFSHKI